VSGLAGLLAWASLDAAVAAAIAGAASLLLAPRAPALRCALWWLACCKMIVGLTGIAAVTLPVLPRAAAPAVRALSPPSVWATQILSPVAAPPSAPYPWGSALAVGWAACGAALFALTAVRWLDARRVVRRARPCTEAVALHELQRLAAVVGLRRAPALLVSDEVSAPQVVGVLTPVILFPGAPSPGLLVDDLTMALCHELVHVRRRDLAIGWLPALAARLFFFHPAAILAAREYALAREQACDAEVVRLLGVAPGRYGELLCAASAAGHRRLAPAVGVSSSFLNLRRRIQMLEHPPIATGRTPIRWAAVGLVAAAILIPVRLAARSDRPEGQAATGRSAGTDDAYVLFLDRNSVTMSGSLEDLDHAKQLRDGKSEKLLWFRRDGAEYVVRDPAVVASALAARGDEAMRAADRQHREMEAELRALERQLDAAARSQERLADRHAQMSAEEAERKATIDARRAEELAREVGRASTRVERLGRNQEALGRELERRAMESDRQMRELMERSIESGAARPVHPII
jgi:beta-lactamase regulating signal transducer with metallopeptidase domain